jgi:hypothetical protein
MRLRRLVLLVPLACGGADVDPKSGTWTYDGSEPQTNTCGDIELPYDTVGNFTLKVEADGSLTIDDATFPDPFTCSRDGDEFSCPERAQGELTQGDIDAKILYHASVSGTIESATELSGTQVVKIDCEGASCDLLADYFQVEMVPCSYSFTFTASAG